MEGAIGTVVKTSTSSAAYPDKTTLKLSDAFEKVEGNDGVNLELEVKVYNIGKGRNEDIVRKCEPLSGYVDFVHIAGERQASIRRENPDMARALAAEKSIAYTVTYCKEHGILKDFFEKLSPEEVNMLAAEWNMEDALRVREEEGIQQGKLDTARNLKSFGIAFDQIACATGLSRNEIAQL
jgi:hypothetical protein